jgi:hypothetical protein
MRPQRAAPACHLNVTCPRRHSGPANFILEIGPEAWMPDPCGGQWHSLFRMRIPLSSVGRRAPSIEQMVRFRS